MGIPETLDHADGRIRTRQVFAEVGRQSLSHVARLVALAAR